jgi:hypothetical protein
MLKELKMPHVNTLCIRYTSENLKNIQNSVPTIAQPLSPNFRESMRQRTQ